MKYFSIIILLQVLYYLPIEAFIKKIPPYQSPSPSPSPSLKQILWNQAVYFTFIEKVSVEFLDESIILNEITNFHMENPRYMENITMLLSFYIGYKYMKTKYIDSNNEKSFDNKMKTFKEYTNARNISRNVLIVLFMIFVKNVSYAS
jgi:hypothetical protein